MTESRAGLVPRLAAVIETRRSRHPLRVAVDGPDAAGKTVLADKLAVVLGERGSQTIRASFDDFRFPRIDRYRRGRYSPDGYYEDSFDWRALRSLLLEPLGPVGNRRYRTRTYDEACDSTVSEPAQLAPSEAVLVVDGVFLLRPELRDAWDVSVFVAARFEETLRRALLRDVPLLGSHEEVERLYRARYIPAQQRYFADVRPHETADVVVDNDDLARPPVLE